MPTVTPTATPTQTQRKVFTCVIPTTPVVGYSFTGMACSDLTAPVIACQTPATCATGFTASPIAYSCLSQDGELTVTGCTGSTITAGSVTTVGSTTAPLVLSTTTSIIATSGSVLSITGLGLTGSSGTINLDSTSELNVAGPVASTNVQWTVQGPMILGSTFTLTATSNTFVTFILTGRMTGTGAFSNIQGIVVFALGAICKVPAVTGGVSTASVSRQLMATSVTSTTTVCGALIGGPTVVVSSGGSLDITQSCLYTNTVIVDSIGEPISVSSTTDVTTTTSVASGGYVQLLSVGESSYLSNFEGDLAFASGSTLVISLAAEPTAAYTKTVLRYESVTCSIANPTISFVNCGLYTCSLSVAAEVTGESCLVTLTVALNNDDNSGLLWLFMLFFIVPVLGTSVYICKNIPQ